MPFSATLFFDVGGVLLTNGWDTDSRQKAVAHFGLDAEDFEMRHAMTKTALETGRLTLERYLALTVFHCPRSFRPDEFRDFIFAQSAELPGALDFVRSLAATGRYRLSTLNNEARELNEYRIRRFGLDQIFLDFFTSCYLGMAKPDEQMYHTVLAITRCASDKGIFIDDRRLNADAARAAGYRSIRYENLDQLRRDLAELHVTAD